MPAIKILKANRNAFIENKDYEAAQRYFNKWTPVIDVAFDRTGNVTSVATLINEEVMMFFIINDPTCEYELAGIDIKPLDIKLEFITTCSECGKEHTIELTDKQYYKMWYDALGTDCPVISDTYLCEDCLNKDIDDQEDEVHRMVRESVESMVQIDKDDYDKEFIDSYERGMRYE